ncbi:MAG: acetylglucosaminyldiphospho-UDP acetyl-beta-D-mannosaminyltransferase [Chloroflexi bacterium]|nr:MAG: acetylglucosaminyldiphospho-UDP acetyl-beta-D-mannosaminyltransferase [Chloroflexota bacterium]
MQELGQTAKPQPPGQRRTIVGVPVDAVDRRQALCLLAGWLASPDGRLCHVVTVNPEFAMAARDNPYFRDVLWGSALATADGVGIVLAGRILGIPTGGRVTGNDLVEGLAALSDPRPRLFLLGAAPGVADAAAEQLAARFPGVQIAGAYAGSPDATAWPGIAERLAQSRPNVLLVAFGHPKQDLWIAAHRTELEQLGVVVSIGVGGVFDYLSGRVPRAPAVLRRVGLEWLYRLVRQPWRWRRQLALPRFVVLVLHQRLRGSPD